MALWCRPVCCGCSRSALSRAAGLLSSLRSWDLVGCGSNTKRQLGDELAAPALKAPKSSFLGKRLCLFFPKMYSICWRFSRFQHTTLQTHCFGKLVRDEQYKDPFKLGGKDLKNLYEDIKKELWVSTTEFKEMCEYYFDGKGKAFRPIIVGLMARACNVHHNSSG
ncbi:all trans-polyprenyl-diphosphate synthase PDSS1-like [Pituophis catenifer annectens]|uniref:all trans-polyprenyl-diphosphate synthase PDSS1-like n=1 Tax=Pituophis catenifer annectens TaxID=94852 RepID=UPI003992FE00